MTQMRKDDIRSEIEVANFKLSSKDDGKQHMTVYRRRHTKFL